MTARAARRANPQLVYYAMLAPALLLLLGSLYPFLIGVWTSLTNQKLYRPAIAFKGLGNYVDLLADSLFWTGLGNTLLYAGLAILIQVPLGLGVALLLEIPSKLRGFFRGTLVLPLLIPPVVAGLMWKTMMHPQAGVLNWLLGTVGIPPFSWLGDPSTAMLSIVVIDTWLFMPFAAIIMLAGLQSVPDEIVDAARVDGARGWRIVQRIKLPLIAPYIVLVVLFRVADCLKSLEIIYGTTRGGPLNATRTLSVMAYEEAYRWSSLGRAMAIVMVLWLVCYLASGLLLGLWQRQERKIHGA
jgi:multiple sugar transport system permease protein